MEEITLPRASTPEEAGVSGGALAAMTREIVDEGLEMHSLMVLRGGRVAYEDYRAPYGAETPHAMYSVSKSVTSIAVGFAVEEGKLRLEDKAADLVPELREADKDERLEQLQVVHLVSMCAGKSVSVAADRTKKHWVRDYGAAKWIYAPGEGWHYCNENIYMLCVILRRVTGESVTDYLMPRLFEPLGIARPFWETDGGGVEAGGWGLFLKTEDMAKIGLCYLHDGVFEGRQVIPAGWVRASSSKQRDNGAASRVGDAGDDQGLWGYGYCFWMNTFPGSYRMDGMFAQFVFVFPAYDACVVTTGGEPDPGAIYRAVFRQIPKLFEKSDEAPVDIPRLPAYEPPAEAPRNPVLEAKLNRRCIRFVPTAQPLGKAVGFPLSMMPAMILFMSADKAGGVDRVHLRFGEDGLKLSWSEGKERNTVLCGMDGRWRKCRVTLGGVGFVLACSAAWEGEELHVRLRNLNSVAQRMLTFRFGARAVRMLPRSLPGLETMTAAAADAVRTGMKSKALGKLVAGVMDKITALAEPTHVGVLR
ncbi:MAG: beta-lactamase family protein [Firmicutes bacterium]|nr:beta-lactamase family protein [Bacillota bacterium]